MNNNVTQINFNLRPIPEKAKSFIKSWEALKLVAYQCSAEKWTIGYGHTKGVSKGQKITKQLAEALLDADLQIAAETIHKYVKVPLNDYQFSALLSFVFNLGESNFRSSTLLKLLNQGYFNLVAEQFLLWNKITITEKLTDGTIFKKKIISVGLNNRRKAEAKLWTSIPASPEAEK